MILTAYMDESGVHRGAQKTVMAGYVGYAGAWRKFEKKWVRMLKTFEIPYFHAKEIFQRDGIAKGWSEDKRNRTFRKSEKISQAHTIFGFSAVLPHDDYDQHYKIVGNRPKGTAIPDSKYGLCFRMCMSALIVMVEQELIGKKGPHTLHVVLEAGHQNAGDAERIFHLMKSEKSTESVRRLLGTITFGEKKECAGAQSADGLAYTSYALEELGTPPTFSHGVSGALKEGKEVAKGQRRQVHGRKTVPLYRLPFTPEQLRELRTHLFVKNPLPTFQFAEDAAKKLGVGESPEAFSKALDKLVPKKPKHGSS
ncbi:MAG TPA: DUF3800 domain-containing protein [Burkholderiales bacterium]